MSRYSAAKSAVNPVATGSVQVLLRYLLLSATVISVSVAMVDRNPLVLRGGRNSRPKIVCSVMQFHQIQPCSERDGKRHRHRNEHPTSVIATEMNTKQASTSWRKEFLATIQISSAIHMSPKQRIANVPGHHQVHGKNNLTSMDSNSETFRCKSDGCFA